MQCSVLFRFFIFFWSLQGPKIWLDRPLEWITKRRTNWRYSLLLWTEWGFEKMCECVSVYFMYGLCNLHSLEHALKDWKWNCESPGCKCWAFILYHIIRVFLDSDMRLRVIGWVWAFYWGVWSEAERERAAESHTRVQIVGWVGLKRVGGWVEGFKGLERSK